MSFKNLFPEKPDPLEHVSDEIQDLAERGWAITFEEWSELRMNSYEQEFLLPYVDNETLVRVTKYYLSQCSRHSNSTYDYAINEHIVPLLLKRLSDVE